jgi:hypothetical protein
MKKLVALLLPFSVLAGPSISGPTAAAQSGPSPTCDQSSLSQLPTPSAGPPPAGQAPGSIPLKMVYHATFPGGSLNCFIDAIHSTPQPLEEGDAQVAGETTTFTPGTQGLVLGLTAPSAVPDDATPSVGLFSTGLAYGPGSFFLVRATFIRPSGPFGGKAWAVALNARTGDKNDLGTDTRLNVTVRFKKGAATLNVFEAGELLKSDVVPASAYDSIVTSPQPFTLELLVNRITGKGAATLTAAGADPQRLSFSLSRFGAKSGPVIQAVGPSLANCCNPGVPVSVEVTDFQIWALPRTMPERG